MWRVADKVIKERLEVVCLREFKAEFEEVVVLVEYDCIVVLIPGRIFGFCGGVMRWKSGLKIYLFI